MLSELDATLAARLDSGDEMDEEEDGMADASTPLELEGGTPLVPFASWPASFDVANERLEGGKALEVDRTLVNLATDEEKASNSTGWALRALTRCADACDELEAHARLSPMTASSAPRLLVAFVQHTFTEVLPSPVVCASRCAVSKESTDEAGAPKDTNKAATDDVAQEQRRVWGLALDDDDVNVAADEAALHSTRRAIGATSRIAQFYAAAVFSLPHDRATSGALAVTLASILAVADMLLRQLAPTQAQAIRAATKLDGSAPGTPSTLSEAQSQMVAEVSAVLGDTRKATYFLNMTDWASAAVAINAAFAGTLC